METIAGIPDKLERQVALFDQHPEAVMVCGATLYWHSWQAIAGRDDRVMQVGQWDKNDGSDCSSRSIRIDSTQVAICCGVSIRWAKA